MNQDPTPILKTVFDQYKQQFPEGTVANLHSNFDGKHFNWYVELVLKGHTFRSRHYIINTDNDVALKQVHEDAVKALAILNGAIHEHDAV
jgi:hypothetical protein